MKQSKSIFERIRLYRINYNRIQMDKENDTKTTSQEIPKEVIRKQSKLKIFLKFVIGFIAGFFEYLVMKSNKKNSTKNTDSLTATIDLANSNDLNVDDSKLEQKKDNIEVSIVLEQVKIDNKKLENLKMTNQKMEENNKTLTKKIDNYKENFVKSENNELKQTKQQLVLIEEQIIYADDYEELETAKSKILKTKQELQVKKNNNIAAIKNLEVDKKQVAQDIEIKVKEDKIVEHIIDESLVKDQDISLDNSEELKTNSQIISQETVPKIEEDIMVNNQEIDKLIERCDEDLILVEEKKSYIDLQKQYDNRLNEVEQDKKEFKLTKKDLKQIKNNVNSILDRQKYNLQRLNDYMNMPPTSQMFMAKMNNFFRSTAKLSFSIIPMFAFPNKLLGLTTSAIMFNNSLKSYRMRPSMNYINQNIKAMISSNELCLRVGINASKESLNEIDNIRYYLNNVPSEVKDTIEYRKYLVDVYSTEKIIKKQIEVLQKMSKNYEDIKVKVKRKDYL